MLDDAATPLNDIGGEDLEEYVFSQIYRRLESEPEFLARSIGEFDAAEERDLETDQEVAELESDPAVLSSLLRLTWERADLTEVDVFRLLLLYTVELVEVGPDVGPISERVRIVWLCAEPKSEKGGNTVAPPPHG